MPELISDLDLSVIRHIVAKSIDERLTRAGHGWLYKKFVGLSESTIRKKQIVASKDTTGFLEASDGWPETQVGFWVLSQDNADLGITTTEVAGAIFVVTTTALSAAAGKGAFGTSVAGLHEAHSRASQFSVSMPSGGIAGKVAMRWMEYGLRNNAVQTGNEWALATRNIIECGAVAISQEGNDRHFYLRRYHSGDVLETFMIQAYKAGIRGGGDSSLKYVRGICTEAKWKYDSDTRKVEKVADSAGLRMLA